MSRVSKVLHLMFLINYFFFQYNSKIGSTEDDYELDEDNECTRADVKILYSSKNSHKVETDKSWKLAPNRYNVQGEVGLNKKGRLGAFWSTLKRAPIGGKQPRLRTPFYDIPRDSEKFSRRCHFQKVTFLTDPRKRRPSSRFMVSNILTCWRNPKDPGPTTYFAQREPKPRYGELKIHYRSPRKHCVPKSARSVKKSSTSNPGPGRYHITDDEDEFLIGIELDKQKRLKFRRLPLKRIHIPKRTPGILWRHIFGHGFRRLFRGTTLPPASKKNTHRLDREIHLYPSSDYIRMITKPNRIPLSIRTEEVTKKPKPMHFNCMVTVIIRRQLRSNKRIAFNSGMPRFPDSYLPAVRKIEKPKPLVDHPVMRMQPSQVQSKLHALPHRLRGVTKENRIRQFKFQPLPPAKLLLDEIKIQSEYAERPELYPTQLDPKEFFKDEFLRH